MLRGDAGKVRMVRRETRSSEAGSLSWRARQISGAPPWRQPELGTKEMTRK